MNGCIKKFTPISRTLNNCHHSGNIKSFSVAGISRDILIPRYIFLSKKFNKILVLIKRWTKVKNRRLKY